MPLSPRPLASDRNTAMSALLAANWWAVALRGAFAIVFGILTFVLPGATLVTLVYLFAGYLIVDGVLAIVAAVRAAERHQRWGFLVLEGVIDVVAAVAAVTSPGLAIVFFVYLVALWSILSGIAMAVAAFRLHLDHGRWLLLVAGLFSLAFGVVLIASPIAGAVVLAMWIGIYALVFGALLLVLAFRLRARHAGGLTPRGGA